MHSLAVRALSTSLLLACACSPLQHDAELHAQDRAIEPPPELAPKERARLDYLFDAADLVARDWLVMGGASPCLFLLGENAQWGVNCDEAPGRDFVRLPDPFRGYPVFVRRGGQFDSGGQSLSTAELLSQMPAAAHVEASGSHTSDLPADHPWLLLGTLDGLIRNHPAFRASSTEEWLSVAIHEYLHTYQLRAPSFADELAQIDRHQLDPSSLRALYENDTAYRDAVKREYALLVDAVRAPPSAAKARLRSWYALYRRRRASLAAREDGARLVHADSVFMYLEGVARYVESAFLVDRSQHPAHSIPGDDHFHDFENWAGGGYAQMPNRQLDPQYYYAIGFHLCLLLERIDRSWKRSVDRQPDRLVGTIERVLINRGRRGAAE
ncbi:MAG TPA: hypothetical protein VHZ95_10105 [Polyangiales bacterium]|nr:hypothetical protein [Polyangiales bacterium]